jgi:hypothetical protein
MNQGNPPPNWYPDPRGEAELRYWDGSQWTEHTHSGQQAGGGETVAAQVPQSAPPPSTAPPPQSAPPPAATAAGPQGAYGHGPGPAGATGTAPGSSGGGNKKLPLIIGGALAAVALLVVLGIVLLGGSDEPTEEDRVRDAAEEILTTEGKGACTKLATQDFVEKSTGQEGDAAFEECDNDPGKLSESSDISKVEVDGSQATVEAKAEGGELDGEEVELSLLKQEDEWKLDDIIRPALLEGEKAEPAVLNTVLNFGSSEGPKACAYLTFSKLKELGGVSGCETQFANATSANYSPDDVSITGTDATVTVTESKQNKTINFTLKHEAGNWKIADFKQE